MNFRLCLGFGIVAAASTVGVSDRAFSQQAPNTQQLDTINVEAQRARRSRAPVQAAQPAPQAPAAPVERGDGPVQGYVATRSVTGTKTDTPIVEIPQSISVVTQDQIRDQGAQTVADALHYTPGVFTNLNGDTARFDETRIRGFQPILYLDGMPLPLNRFFATPLIPTYALQRLEVLRGPSSVLYGQNSPGGMINMVSKRPTDVAFGEIELSAGNHNTWQGAFDIGGPGNADKTFLYRLTGLIRDSDTAVDFSKDKRAFFAPAFTWRNLDTSLTVLAHYGKDEGSFPQQYLPAQGTLFFNPNGQIPRSRFAGEPGWDNFRREQWWAGYAFEHRFNDVWQFRQNLRYGAVDTEFQAFRSEGLQADLVTLERGAYHQAVDAGTFTIDNQFQGDFSTGALRHKLLFGLDYLRTSGDFRMLGNSVLFGGTGLPINIYNPGYGGAIPALAEFQDYHDKMSQLGVYVQDQIKLDRWILTLGGRHDWSKVSTLNRIADTTVSASNGDFSGRAGLGYAFDNGVTPYVAVATSFQQEVGVNANGDPFKPTKGLQYEAGVKYQPIGTKALFTAAIFDLTRRNVVTSNPFTFESSQTGEVHVRGLELEAKADLTDRLDMVASYAYMDSEITQSINPLELGRPAPMTPRHSASGWLNYALLPGLKIGGGVRYVGENFSQTESTDQFPVPSYVVYDAAATYDFSVLNSAWKGLELRINVTNLFDKYYVTYCYQLAFCSLASGRTVLATMSYKW